MLILQEKFAWFYSLRVLCIYWWIGESFPFCFFSTRAHAVHRAYGGACVQMRLSYSSMAPIILNLIQWMDCSCSLSYTLPSYLGLLEVLVYKVQNCPLLIRVTELLNSRIGHFCRFWMLTWSWLNIQVYVDEDASISTIERRASLKEFYGMLIPHIVISKLFSWIFSSCACVI